MPTESELLTALREAAQRRDWNGCHDALDALLSRLPAPTMLRIAHDEVARRLPLFERHHPHQHWPRIWLDALASGAPFTFDESAPEVLEESPGPGGNSFAKGVMELALAAAADGPQRVVHAREAISEAIMAEETEVGGSAHRELWDLWFQDALNPGEHSYYWVLDKISKDPNAVAAGLAAWNRLADEIAAALGVTG